jgi:hypothetical protein
VAQAQDAAVEEVSPLQEELEPQEDGPPQAEGAHQASFAPAVEHLLPWLDSCCRLDQDGPGRKAPCSTCKQWKPEISIKKL